MHPTAQQPLFVHFECEAYALDAARDVGGGVKAADFLADETCVAHSAAALYTCFLDTRMKPDDISDVCIRSSPFFLQFTERKCLLDACCCHAPRFVQRALHQTVPTHMVCCE